MNKKTILIILAIIFPIVIIALLLGTIFYLDTRSFGESEIIVSNVTESQMTLAWSTDTAVAPKLLVQSSDESWGILPQLSNVANIDDRDTALDENGEYVLKSEHNPRQTHHITFRNLEPETSYKFRQQGILFGKNIEVPVEAATTASINEDIYTPDPAYGKIQYEDESVPEDTIIVVDYEDYLQTIPLSDNGTYSFDVAQYEQFLPQVFNLQVLEPNAEQPKSLGSFTNNFYKPLNTKIIDNVEDNALSGDLQTNIQAQEPTAQPLSDAKMCGNSVENLINNVFGGSAPIGLESALSSVSIGANSDNFNNAVICELTLSFPTYVPDEVIRSIDIFSNDELFGQNLIIQTGALTGYKTVPVEYCVQRDDMNVPIHLCTNKKRITLGSFKLFLVLLGLGYSADISSFTPESDTEEDVEVVTNQTSNTNLNDFIVNPNLTPIVVSRAECDARNIDVNNLFSGRDSGLVVNVPTSNLDSQGTNCQNEVDIFATVCSSPDQYMSVATEQTSIPTFSCEISREVQVNQEQQDSDDVSIAIGDETTGNDQLSEGNDIVEGSVAANPTGEQNYLSRIVTTGSAGSTNYLSNWNLESCPAVVTLVPIEVIFPDIQKQLTNNGALISEGGVPKQSLENLTNCHIGNNVYTYINDTAAPQVQIQMFRYDETAIRPGGRDSIFGQGNLAYTFCGANGLENNISCADELDDGPFGIKILERNGVLVVNIATCIEGSANCQVTIPSNNIAGDGSETSLNPQIIEKLSAQESNSTITQSGDYQFFANGENVAETEIVLDESLDAVEVVLYNDVNQNGYYDIDDTLIESSDVSFEQTQSVEQFLLSSGWNLIHLPLVDISDNSIDTAGKLLDHWQNQSAEVVHIARFADGRFEIYSDRDDSIGNVSEDFNLIPGSGYFVLNTGATIQTTIGGNRIDENLEIELDNGWNLVGLTNIDTLSATTLLENNQNVDTISDFSGGRYQSLISDTGTIFGNDFNMISTKGYFMRADGDPAETRTLSY